MGLVYGCLMGHRIFGLQKGPGIMQPSKDSERDGASIELY